MKHCAYCCDTGLLLALFLETGTMNLMMYKLGQQFICNLLVVIDTLATLLEPF